MPSNNKKGMFRSKGKGQKTSGSISNPINVTTNQIPVISNKTWHFNKVIRYVVGATGLGNVAITRANLLSILWSQSNATGAASQQIVFPIQAIRLKWVRICSLGEATLTWAADKTFETRKSSTVLKPDTGAFVNNMSPRVVKFVPPKNSFADMVSKVGLEESEVLFELQDLNTGDIVDLSVTFDLCWSYNNDGLDTIASGTLTVGVSLNALVLSPLNTFAVSAAVSLFPQGNKTAVFNQIASRP